MLGLHRLTFVVVTVFALSGCDMIRQQFSGSAPAREMPTPLADAQHWWAPMQDPLIDILADELVAQNLDLRMALARVDEARGMSRVASSDLFPSIGLGGNAQRGNRQDIKEVSIAQGGFDASWELDLFGRVRAGISAADARIEQSAATADDVRNTILAELVRHVIAWRTAQQTIVVTESLLHAQDEQINLFRARADAGLADRSALERAIAEREQTATELPLAAASAKAAQHQMERLLAKEPGSLMPLLESRRQEHFVLPDRATVLALDISMVRERPDVRAKRAALVASNADLDQAEAAIWPKLSLSAFFGGQSSTEGAFIASNPLWSVAANATMPLLNFGRIRGAIDAADARTTQAELDYENTTLMALQETHTALSDFINGAAAVERQDVSLAHRKDAVDLAKQRFSSGLTDMTDVTTAQSELDMAALTLLKRKADAAYAFVRLQKSLAGATAPAAADSPAIEDAAPDATEQPDFSEESAQDTAVEE